MAQTPAVDVNQALAACPVFGPLPEAARERLARACRIENFSQATLLNAAGEPLQSLRLVIRGHIEIIARSVGGEETALADLGPGDWITWMACLGNTVPDHDFYSAARTTCLTLPCALVRETVAAHPDAYVRVIQRIGKRMRLLMEWTGQSVMLAPEQRMAKLLHVMVRAYGSVEGNRASLPTTQARLARQARCSRQLANQLLGALEERGLVRRQYGRYELDDLARLVAFSEQEP